MPIATLTEILNIVETHSGLIQAMAAIVTSLIAASALLYTVKSLRLLQQQTQASIAMAYETFRPVLEVLGGSLSKNSEIDFINKGQGSALNFRWRVDEDPELWRGYSSNIIPSKETGHLKAQINWKKGLVLSYNSVAHREELRTHVRFHDDGSVSNSHEVSQGHAVTRQGWTLIDPQLAIPAFHPGLIRSMPL